MKRNSSAELNQYDKSFNNVFQEEVDRGNQIGQTSESVPKFVFVQNKSVLKNVLNEGIGFIENMMFQRNQ